MDHRRFRRIPFEAVVSISTEQDKVTGELLDVALKGAMVGTDKPLAIPLGTKCGLVIALPDSPISLDFKAELVHMEENRSGFIFISEDLETFTHLRKLIELNTGDAEATRSELAAWLSR